MSIIFLVATYGHILLVLIRVVDAAPCYFWRSDELTELFKFQIQI